jgi:hypothetical protein
MCETDGVESEIMQAGIWSAAPATGPHGLGEWVEAVAEQCLGVKTLHRMQESQRDKRVGETREFERPAF